MIIKSVQVVGRIYIENEQVDGVIVPGKNGVKMIETARAGHDQQTSEQFVCLHHENGALIYIPLGLCIITGVKEPDVQPVEIPQAEAEELPEPEVVSAVDALPTPDEVQDVEAAEHEQMALPMEAAVV